MPAWFIKLFTKPGDLVLDPFAGSGTTVHVARELGRNAIGIEILKENCDLAQMSLKDFESPLFAEVS